MDPVTPILRQISRILILWLLILVAGDRSVCTAANVGVQAAFVKNNTIQDASEVAANVLRIVNYTNKKVRFGVSVGLPAGWITLGNRDRMIDLPAGDSVFIPVRAIPDRQAKGGTSYVLSAILRSEQDQQFAADNWYVTIKSHSDWRVNVPQRQIYFTIGSDSANFSVQISNQGNSDESIRLVFLPDRRIQLLDPVTKQPAALTITCDLPVGHDTVVRYAVRKVTEQRRSAGKKDLTAAADPNRESYPVQVLARSAGGTGNRSWSGNITFARVGNRVAQHLYSGNALPLTMEVNLFDVLTDGTTMSLDLYGSTNLRNNVFLTYRLQSVFITNYLNEQAFLGQNHYIGYFSSRYTVEAGEVNGWGRSLLTGRGLKASVKVRNETIGAIYVRGPGLFRNNPNSGYGLYHQHAKGPLTWSNYFTRNENRQLKLTTNAANTYASYKAAPGHQLGFGMGMSSERFRPDTAEGSFGAGYGFDANYSGTYGPYGFFANYNYGSSQYALYRGVRMFNTRLSWAISQDRNLSLNTQHFTQRPEYFVNGRIIDGPFLRNQRYELRYGIFMPKAMIAFRPLYQFDENPRIRVRTTGMGFDYNVRNNEAMRVSTNLFMGYGFAPTVGLDPFFLARAGVYARWNTTFLSLRYFYGPNQLQEQIRFISYRINPQSVFLTGSNDYWFGNGKFVLTTTGNLFYETFYKRLNTRIRPELFYFTNTGFRFSMYVSWVRNAQSANPVLNEITGEETFEPVANADFNIGFGVKKQLGVPLPGPKYISTKVIVFRDMNGNRRQDGQEDGVENILVTIRPKRVEGGDTLSYSIVHGEDFITDKKGEVWYDNITPGIYYMRMSALVGQGDWFTGEEQEVVVRKGEPVYLPLNRGLRLNGSILVDRDKYSGGGEGTMDLSRIRITAIDSLGHTYTCLSERDGTFNLQLPMGKYTLTANEAALGDGFLFLRNKIELDLTRYVENYSVTFNVVERKRKVEIKRFGGSEKR